MQYSTEEVLTDILISNNLPTTNVRQSHNLLSEKELIAEEVRSVALSSVITDPSNATKLLLSAMNDNKHSWSQLTGYTREEVNYAFHNHGSHHELLDMDVTDIASHYVLLHFDAQNIEKESYQLEITGLFKKPRRFSLDDIMSFPKHTVQIVMECAGSDRVSAYPRFNHHSPWGLQPISQAEWTGCLLTDVLGTCQLSNEAVDLVFSGSDQGIESGKVVRYERSLNIQKDDILHDCLLVYAMNGQPLPKKHGYPLRLMVPGWYGMASVKYLVKIEAINKRFRGPGMTSYTYSIHEKDHDLIQPVTIIRPRAIIKYPGIAEFFTRNRYLTAGRHVLMGRAWVGGSTIRKNRTIIKIDQVSLSFDNGNTWNNAEIVKEATSPWGWCKWEYTWTVEPGIYTIFVRAYDSNNVGQPVWPEVEFWDYRGMGTIATQRLTVHVLPELCVGMESIQAAGVGDPKPIPRDHY